MGTRSRKFVEIKESYPGGNQRPSAENLCGELEEERFRFAMSMAVRICISGRSAHPKCQNAAWGRNCWSAASSPENFMLTKKQRNSYGAFLVRALAPWGVWGVSHPTLWGALLRRASARLHRLVWEFGQTCESCWEWYKNLNASPGSTSGRCFFANLCYPQKNIWKSWDILSAKTNNPGFLSIIHVAWNPC